MILRLLLSITRVDTSSDLHECRVYFSLLDEKKVPKAQDTLDKMSKFIKVNLGKRIRLKLLPELRFLPDDSMRYSVYIYDKIEQARSGDSDRKTVQEKDGNDRQNNRDDKQE